MRPSNEFASLLARGRLPNATVDFPRRDAAGNPIAQVYLRVLTQMEVDAARANAAAYVAQMTHDSRDSKWRPEELEDNAVVAEILAVSCRKAEDPEQPFFPHGVVDARCCSNDELAQLFAVYSAVKEKSYKFLSEMSEAECWAFLRVLEEGAQNFPFSQVSRAKLEAFCAWVATSLVSLARHAAGTTTSGSPPSPSSGSLDE